MENSETLSGNTKEYFEGQLEGQKKEISYFTGFQKNTHIQYFLNDKYVAERMIGEGSCSEERIKEFENIVFYGKTPSPLYYNRFILDNGRADSKEVFIDGEPLNDYVSCSKNLRKNIENYEVFVEKFGNYKSE
jgi:hypothetical protein